MANAPSPHPSIGDYALIGDCHSAALIASDGSVDWFCPERFDAPAVFCRLLDVERGGYLRTMPSGSFAMKRRYLGLTNVLETTFSAPAARVRATDLMPIFQRTSGGQGHDVGSSHRLLRRVEALEGAVEVEVYFKPTFDYARAQTTLASRANGGAVAQADGSYLTLACPGLRLTPDGHGALTGRICLRAGEECWVVLTWADDPHRAEEALAPVDCAEQLARTLRYWEDWAGKCTYHGPYRDQVVRSALVLKLLTYEPTGAIVAAPTTSLPERLGGQRNWDYRYTWLRDSSLILYALLSIGFEAEAADFMHWLEHTLGSDPTPEGPQIMYGIDGRRNVPEEVLDQLTGYHGSRPVRVGNAAAKQRQLDIYGEVLRAAALHYLRDSDTHSTQPPSTEAWKLLRRLVDRAAEEWAQPGSGIWEVRGEPQQFLYGKLMCWVALDSGIALANEHKLEAPLARWRDARDEIRQAILDKGYDQQLGTFTQAFGSSRVDAGALVIPRVGFLPPTDPRVKSTIDQIRKQLTKEGLVYRYRTQDDQASGEGTFTLCTFWLVEALALSGRPEDARTLFEHTLSYASDLGLLAEEIDPATSEQLGNFPQGFSHMALIGAVVNLGIAAGRGADHRAQSETESGRASHTATQPA